MCGFLQVAQVVRSDHDPASSMPGGALATGAAVDCVEMGVLLVPVNPGVNSDVDGGVVLLRADSMSKCLGLPGGSSGFMCC